MLHAALLLLMLEAVATDPIWVGQLKKLDDLAIAKYDRDLHD
jgi:hypothetical protein